LEAIVQAERFYRNDEPIAFRSRRVLEVAAGCLQANSQQRLKPVLEAFGILGPMGQGKMSFDGDLEDEDSEDESGEVSGATGSPDNKEDSNDH
jgi:guanylate kinase